jgi:hypothetical protein
MNYPYKYPSKFEKGQSSQYQIALINKLYKLRIHREIWAKTEEKRSKRKLVAFKPNKFRPIVDHTITGYPVYATPEDMDALYRLPHYKR